MSTKLIDEFQKLWASADDSPDVFEFLRNHDGYVPSDILPVLLHDQRMRWRTKVPWNVEFYIENLPGLETDQESKFELVVGEFQARQSTDTLPEIDEFASRFPDISHRLRQLLTKVGCEETAVISPARRPETNRSVTHPSKLHERDDFQLTQSIETNFDLGDVFGGRYRLIRILGEGAFGRVHLAVDEELRRQVAIKMPTAERFKKPEDAQAYLAEAQTVASLDHTNIVPVYDVGRTEDGSIYIVSKYIDGPTLTELIGEGVPAEDVASQIIAPIAIALHHAHQNRLIHRDVKPGNILLEDRTGKPYLADFGLAIREEDYLSEGHIAGTPAYMSPEQARGEGHRLDGRSDIFSLGIVFYELLTAKRPFRGSTANELFHQVISVDPLRPRDVNESIPQELERICIKALSKRASDRYSTAAELADDLLNWRQGPEFQTQDLTIVPKGLRSFDDGDADFFLDLLPGPRNRDGLPESIQFWKTRIEERDSDKTFSVGLIYGPSGCGKSSLVKAGLRPRISKEIVVVHVEATPDETEARLLRGLRKQLSGLPHDLGLVDTFTWLRRNEGAKVLIVLDQFEQWLHHHGAEQEAGLVRALRQCDGGSLQTIVMVRDDFAMAAARFMDALDIPILQGHNFVTVDRFDVVHSEKVLTKFGQAFGKLPATSQRISDEQHEFVNAVVSGLAEDEKVVSVRLALFAEMVKGKTWEPATLAAIGGTEGIGVNFLEETFGARSANPTHRLHEQAARKVLKSLLPEVGSDIKGHMRSHADLLEDSGYQGRAREFNELLRILDGELRLITPTDPEGAESRSGSDPGSKFYQLTHDYLVTSLREWLTRKQQETRRGRSELKLAERASLWSVKPEARYLPSLAEWLNIRVFTDTKQWTQPQRAMVRGADRFHLSRLTTAVVLLGLITASGFWIWNRVDRDRQILLAEKAMEQESIRIEGLVGRLVSAEPNQLPGIVKELDANAEAASIFLSPLVTMDAETVDEKRAQLHARMGRVSHDPSLVDLLAEELLTGKVTYVAPIRQILRPSATVLTEKYRAILRDENAGIQLRFRAALALADYLPASETAAWTEQDLKITAEQLVSSNAEIQPLLRDALRPIRMRLYGNLTRIFADPMATDAQQLSAANAFADYAGSDIAKLSELLTVATPEQYAVLYRIVAASPEQATVAELARIAATDPPNDMGSVARVPYGQRRANAAVTLLRLGEHDKAMPVFAMTDDPEALTQFMFRCRPRGVGVEELLDCLHMVNAVPKERYPDHSKYALLLALREFSLEEIPERRRGPLLRQLAGWYRNDPSSGVHGAVGWLLRQWGQDDIAQEVDQTPVPYSPDREWFTLAVTVNPLPPPTQIGTNAATEPLPRKMFSFTFVVFPAGEYTIGSVNDEPFRSGDETRHPVKLTRPFALLDREITWEELISFSSFYTSYMRQPDEKLTQAGAAVHWYDSVQFCRWLGQQSGLSEADQPYADPATLDQQRYSREPNPRAKWAPLNWPLDLGRRGFRLPTETEFEVACRAGSRTTFGFGSDVSMLGNFGWFAGNSGKHAHPPRELRPSVRGLFDLHGNLFEWTHDWMGDYSRGMVTDPLGAKEGSLRVRRGGSWNGNAANCRSARRLTDVPADRAGNRGFRLAISLNRGVDRHDDQ